MIERMVPKQLRLDIENYVAEQCEEQVKMARASGIVMTKREQFGRKTRKEVIRKAREHFGPKIRDGEYGSIAAILLLVALTTIVRHFVLRWLERRFPR